MKRHAGTPSFIAEATSLRLRLADRRSVVIIGSTSYWHPDSPATCSAIGRRLAAIEDLIIITGGMTGIGEGVGRSACTARREQGRENDIWHLLPRGFPQWDYGLTLFAGEDLAERREILGRISGLYITIEGGPGTVHEASVAATHGVVLLPVGRSGGHAGELYAAMPRPRVVPQSAWETLGCASATPDEIAAAIFAATAEYIARS